MNIELMISLIGSVWHIDPVRWIVYGALLLAVLYVYTMRLKRIRDGKGLSLTQKIIGAPIAGLAIGWNWFYNLTANSFIFRELPKSRTELTTHRLQRVLDNPEKYVGYRLTIALWLKPFLNAHDKGHLE